MNDELAIQNLYRKMYGAMISKDSQILDEILDESFVLVHMTGMHQSKKEFINAVVDGTLNYYSAEHENTPVSVTGDTAEITGQSYVNAAVFGGGKHYWHLQQLISMKKSDGEWKMTKSIASTY